MSLSDTEFEHQFLACTLNPAEFSHEAHLRLAWIHIDRYGLEQAEKNIQTQLQNFVVHAGAADKYNTTLTLAAIKAVAHFMRKAKSTTFLDFIAEVPRLKYNFKELMACHYSFDIFTSATARGEYLEPDLLPFDGESKWLAGAGKNAKHMKAIEPYFQLQYELVRSSREVLFGYCETIASKDFINEHSAFGRGGSIRNLLVHIANTYEYWIVNHALKKDVVFTLYTAIQTMEEIRTLFEAIDSSVFDFSSRYEPSKLDPLHLEVNGIEKDTTAFELFTHVITHEFHHKGQILSLSRHLGYTPVDTDVMR